LIIGGLVVDIGQRFLRVEIFGNGIDLLLGFGRKRGKGQYFVDGNGS